MKQQISLVNDARMIGRIISKPKFDHEMYGEGFYSTTIEIPRLSACPDILPIIFPERTVDRSKLIIGTYVEIKGQLRSHNNYSEGRKLLLNIFAQNVTILTEEPTEFTNEVFLSGYICKKPTYRTTPFGRQISDVLLAVNRSYHKSDYIPCIVWGRNATFASELEVSENIEITGRFQSRDYTKQLDTGELLNKTAYEVSVTTIELVNNEEE